MNFANINGQTQAIGVTVQPRGRGISLICNKTGAKIPQQHITHMANGKVRDEDILKAAKIAAEHFAKPATHILFDGARGLCIPVRATIYQERSGFTSWETTEGEYVNTTDNEIRDKDLYSTPLFDEYVVVSSFQKLEGRGKTPQEAFDAIDAMAIEKGIEFIPQRMVFSAVADLVYDFDKRNFVQEGNELQSIFICMLESKDISKEKKTQYGPVTYTVETTELKANWNDSGFRHRIVSSDGRSTKWAPYTNVAYMDDIAAVTDYFHGEGDIKLMSLKKAMEYIGYGETSIKERRSSIMRHAIKIK